MAQKDGDWAKSWETGQSLGHVSHVEENKSLFYQRSRSIKAQSLHSYP